MIVFLRFRNFYSFREEAQISFEVGKKPSVTGYDVDGTKDIRLNKVLAVVGPNGSGKTQFIKPLAFLSWFIADSYLDSEPDSEIPYSPHMLSASEPTSFELRFLFQEVEYLYKLVVAQSKVIHESLHKKTSHLFSYVFMRDLNSDTNEYSYKQKKFGFSAAQASSIRGNSSLISAAYRNDVKMAKDLVQYFRSYSHNMSVSGRHHYEPRRLFDSAEYFSKNDTLSAQMQKVLCEIDLGISSVVIEEREQQDNNGNVSSLYIPFAEHEAEEAIFSLPLFAESSGTQSAFVLLRKLLPVLKDGGVAVIDEIDNDLHPHVLPYILEMFRNSSTNQFQAQLVFTCHTPEVLNLLSKHQVYLVEKVEQCSEQWRLDEIKGLRSDDNLYAKYMAGALGATPSI